jgi:electron transfer flavoprotein alpha subunit
MRAAPSRTRRLLPSPRHRSWARCTSLVAGAGVAGVAAEAAKIAGVGKVHVADDAAYDHALAENVAPLIVELMGHHDAFVAPATSNGKNIAPRVAALLDVMQLSDILSVESADTFTRPTYAGNAIATVKTSDAKLVITVRGTAFEKAAKDGGSAASKLYPQPATRVFPALWRGDRQARTAGTDQRQGDRLGRSRPEGRPHVRGDDLPARRQARRGRGREPRCRRCGLCPQ